MRKKISRMIGMFALVGAMSLCNAAPVNASSIMDKVQSTETDADHAEDISYSLLRGNHLNYGATDITKVSSNEINITGITQCHNACDTVYLQMYLEQKNGGSYSTYDSWEYTKSNATNLIRSLNVIVPRGHYYRVRGYHAAEDGGSFESTSTLTQGVWVN